MIGYNANDSMTQKEKVAAGCLSGVLTKFITQPMDVIKIRSQLQKHRGQRLTTYRIASKIFWEEGIRAFWHGHTLGQVFSVLSVTTLFTVYDLTTHFMNSTVPKDYKHFTNFLCGIASGCASTTLVIPLEVIRTRQMLVKDQYRSIFHGAKTVYRYGGFGAFYEGLSASLLQMGPQVGFQFAIFNFVQPLILENAFKPCPPTECIGGNKHRATDLAVASSLAGSVAGFLSKSLTYPFDLVKRRLQIGTHRTSLKYKTPTQARELIRCDTILRCLMYAYQKEGIRGLFRGWSVTVYKAQMTSVAAFTSYEMLCFAFREFHNISK